MEGEKRRGAMGEVLEQAAGAARDPAKKAPDPGEKRPAGHAVKTRARHEFDGWAHGYDRSIVQHLLFQPAYRMFMEELYRSRRDDPSEFDLLDIGSGTGTWIAMVAATSLPARRLVGLDFSAQMTQVATRKASSIQEECRPQFVNGDSEHLPFASGSFDVVTCSHSFHHYPHQEKVIAEMHRVLRPGGRLMVIDGFRDNVIGWVLFDVFITRGESTPEARVHHVSWARMRQFFMDAGFHDIHQAKDGVWAPICLTSGIV